jgi:hypothetical protein
LETKFLRPQNFDFTGVELPSLLQGRDHLQIPRAEGLENLPSIGTDFSGNPVLDDFDALPSFHEGLLPFGC